MSNAAPLQDSIEHRQGSAEHIQERILILAAHGLKVRDISSALGIHPLIVKRVLESSNATQPTERT